MPLALAPETVRQNPGDTLWWLVPSQQMENITGPILPHDWMPAPQVKNEEGPQVHVSQSMMANATGDVVKWFVVVSEPSPTIISYSLGLGSRKSIISDRLRKEVELQKDVECKLTNWEIHIKGDSEKCSFLLLGAWIF